MRAGIREEGVHLPVSEPELSQHGPRVAEEKVSSLEARPHLAWARLEDASAPAVLLRTERLGELIADDLTEGAPAEALAAAAQRLLPGVALRAQEGGLREGSAEGHHKVSVTDISLGVRLATFAKAGTSGIARSGWKRGRALAEGLFGEERVGRALHPLKVQAEQLAPSLRGAARALIEKRVPRGLQRLVPPSVREERAMLDRLGVGAPIAPPASR